METKERDKLLASAPKLRKEDLDGINATFQHYIFRQRKTREIWTTCCHQHAILPEGDPILEAEHVAMPEKYEPHDRCTFGVWGLSNPPKRPPKVKCPICGAEADVKELGRTGKRTGLYEWTRGVVLRQYRGALYALVYDASKGYETKEEMLALPDAIINGVYKFTKGRVQYARRDWWLMRYGYGDKFDYYGEVTTPPEGKLKRMIQEPFHNCRKYDNFYDVVGMEELDRSQFRYCQIKRYVGDDGQAHSLIGLLALCTQWPRQVEMLTKMGLKSIVTDLIEGRRWNSEILDWREADPVKSIALTKEELQEYRAMDFAHGNPVEVLRYYKRLKKSKAKNSMKDVLVLTQEISSAYLDKVATRLKWCDLSISKWMKYVQSEVSGKRTFPALVELWSDYIDAARDLGYDLKNPIYATPRGLQKKHDKAVEAAAPIRGERLKKEALKKETEYTRKRFPALSERYDFEDERWLIRVPYDATEIVEEGKALKHCVGGYAERHIKGRTVILFLRDKRRPEKSLVTIEMRGNTIVQIHGYRDDLVPCKENPKRTPPRELYGEILDPWLDWLAKGSKRNKVGQPKLPKKKKEVKVA